MQFARIIMTIWNCAMLICGPFWFVGWAERRFGIEGGVMATILIIFIVWIAGLAALFALAEG